MSTQSITPEQATTTTVYIVVIEDRHTDVRVEAFATREAAVRRARAVQVAYGFDDPDGWPYYARLSNEGDCVRVQAVEVQGATP